MMHGPVNIIFTSASLVQIPVCAYNSTMFVLSCVFSMSQLHALRALKQGDGKHPKAPLGNNFRPPQPLHLRPVRTNIDFNVKQVNGSFTFLKSCVAGSSEMKVKYPISRRFHQTKAASKPGFSNTRPANFIRLSQ